MRRHKRAFSEIRRGSIISRRVTPELSIEHVLHETEGAGKAGCPLAPMVRVQQKARGRTTGTADHPAFLRNGFTAYT